jgi:hypothetical protein
MPAEERDELEITDEQIRILRELGVDELTLQGMSADDADDLIDELRTERDSGKFERR